MKRREFKAPEWYQKRDIVKLKKEWYAKLKGEGFYDVEGGVEGHLLLGPTPSRRFHVIKEQMRDLRSTKVDVNQILSMEDELVNFMDSHKANYYQLAQLLVAQAFRLREPAEDCFTWLLHSLGVGERTIADELGLTRSRVRGSVQVLKRSVGARLTSDGEEVTVDE